MPTHECEMKCDVSGMKNVLKLKRNVLLTLSALIFLFAFLNQVFKGYYKALVFFSLSRAISTLLLLMNLSLTSSSSW
jgi:hypothetical protein